MGTNLIGSVICVKHRVDISHESFAFSLHSTIGMFMALKERYAGHMEYLRVDADMECDLSRLPSRLPLAG